MTGAWEPVHPAAAGGTDDDPFGNNQIDGLVFADDTGPAELRIDPSDVAALNPAPPPERPAPSRRRRGTPAADWSPDAAAPRNRARLPRTAAQRAAAVALAVVVVGGLAAALYALATWYAVTVR